MQGSGVLDPLFSLFVHSLVECEMGVRRALGSRVHRPTPDAERQISLVGVFIRSIQVCECAFALHQQQKRDHFGAVAIDAHRMFHRDSTALTTRASGLGWTCAGLPHIQGSTQELAHKTR